MGIPDYQSLMLPLLQFASGKNGETSTGEAVEVLVPMPGKLSVRAAMAV